MTSEKVVLSVSLAMTDPNTISIGDPNSSDSLRLIATVQQLASPFQDRSITILTNYTALANDESAFDRQMMGSPVSVTDKKREIYMWPYDMRIHWSRSSGDPNMREFDEMKFLTIPAVGQGVRTVEWDMSPATVLKRYGGPASLEEKLAKFKPGERFKIEVRNPLITWWTWGALESDLKSKKFARWSFPDELPLNRAPEGDETEEMVHRLVDYVYGHDVNYLNSRSAVEDEETPDIKEMRKSGWVFGEPSDGVDMVGENAAVFEFVK